MKKKFKKTTDKQTQSETYNLDTERKSLAQIC